jgi:hypothetical protein
MLDLKIFCEFDKIESVDISLSSRYNSGVKISGTWSRGKSRRSFLINLL